MELWKINWKSRHFILRMMKYFCVLDRLRLAGSFKRQRDLKHLEVRRESQKDFHETYCSDGKMIFVSLSLTLRALHAYALANAFEFLQRNNEMCVSSKCKCS